MRSYLSSCLLAGMFLIRIACPVIAADPNEFLEFSTTGLPGRLFVPPEAMPANDLRPFVLFLHGDGERGTDNVNQVNINIDNLLDAAKQEGSFLYAPQTTGEWRNYADTTMVMDMIDQALMSYPIDPTRIYVTGLSLGGGGTWNMMNRHADRFAAGVPIAAVGPSFDFFPQNILGVPTWAFHARNDTVVPTQLTRQIVDGVLFAGGKNSLLFPPLNDSTTNFEFSDAELNLNYTEWPTGGHNIWGRAYGDMELRDWMFAQAIPIPEPGTLMLLASGLTMVGWMRNQKRVEQANCTGLRS